jgi:hypothetical protein
VGTTRTKRRALTAVAAVALALVGCTHGPGRPDPGPGGPGQGKPLETYKGYKSELYSDGSKWRCRPDRDDAVCDHDLDITVVKPDGSTEIQKRRPAERAPIDCFYVYPTVSRDTTPNSDFTPGENEEDLAIRYQAAQLGTECRLYAPIYRQATLGGIRPPASTTTTTAAPGAMAVEEPSTTTTTAPPATTTTTTAGPTTTVPQGPNSREIAYGDVLDAFKHYIANDNKGRGFIIVGHSQGTGHLATLMHNEIEPNPELRSHMVSALLIGGATRLGTGENDIKVCTKASDLGCVVSYASYRAGQGPSGPLANPNAVCTNPGALGGGKALLKSVWNASRSNVFTPGEPLPWATSGAATNITTDFVSTPGLVTGECVTGESRYFAITVNADPADPRTDDITGDLGGGNLHLMDVALASGDLQDIIREQTKAYGDRRGGGRPDHPAGTRGSKPHHGQ